MIIVIPLLICLVNNIIIFIYVRLSSRRIQPGTRSIAATGGNDQQQPRINRRDIHLLWHMLAMLLSFIISWTPVYAVAIMSTQSPISQLTFQVLSLLSEIGIVCDIIDLFLYNHGLRLYLRQIILRCC
jgi:hypothetical protein